MAHEKLRDLVLFTFMSKPCYSKVKLNKALYYFDSFWYAAKGKSYTGCDYTPYRMGPVCDGLNSVLRDLVQKNLLQENELENLNGTFYSAYVLTDKGELEAQSLDDKQEGMGFFRSLLNDLSSMRQDVMVEMSHNRAWDVAQAQNTKIDFKNNDWL
jgi:hypothetical protein